MPKVLMDEECKKAFDAAYRRSTENITKRELATELIAAGIDELEKNPPQGNGPHRRPYALGRKSVEYNQTGRIGERLEAFARSRRYANREVAARACLFKGLGVDDTRMGQRRT
jgi:hypothetical protein